MSHKSKESLGKYGILLKRGWTWHVVEGDHWTATKEIKKRISFGLLPAGGEKSLIRKAQNHPELMAELLKRIRDDFFYQDARSRTRLTEKLSEIQAVFEMDLNVPGLK
jgi:hypothetical protein